MWAAFLPLRHCAVSVSKVCVGNNGGQEDLEDKACDSRPLRYWKNEIGLQAECVLSSAPRISIVSYQPFSLFLHRDETDGPHWLAIREYESTIYHY